MHIINRKGILTPYNPQRIKKVISLCMNSSDSSLTACELETKLRTRFVDGVTTTQEIQDNAINAAVSLTTDLDSSEWLKVAGSLNLWDLNKRIDSDRPSSCKDSLWSVIKFQINQGVYPNFSWLEDDVNRFDSLTKDIDPSSLFDYAGSQIVRKRYLLPLEKPSEMFKVSALILSGGDVEEAVTIYKALASLKISLATPFLANLRSEGGNLSSCFITKVEDSLLSITDKITETAFISKNGGGVGLNISSVRSKGSVVNGIQGASGGITPWIKLFNDMLIAVSQVKSRRKGAATVAIEVWHKDIHELLELQTENGDLRLKAYDIFPQVVINDLFMTKCILDEEWHLFNPYDLEQAGINLINTWGDEWNRNYNIAITTVLSTVVKARDLMKSIMRTMIETGLPYLFFKDTVNADNVNKSSGQILNGNLCMESFSNFSADITHCCNLISINLARVEDDTELAHLARLSVRLLDRAIDLTHTPNSKSDKHNADYRTIGVGVMGLADYLAKRELEYCKENVEELFKTLSYNCVRESCNQAKQKGSYKMFDLNKNNWLERVRRLYPEHPELLQDIEEYGMRNGQLMAIAPNSSTSVLYGCTASVLPPYNLFFTNKDGQGTVPIVAPFARTHRDYYAVNKSFDQRKIIEVVSTIQKYVDQGISMELLFDLNNPDFNARYLFDTIVKAWNSKCKTIYYIRTIQKSLGGGCTSCAN